jgi:hypothetical protein
MAGMLRAGIRNGKRGVFPAPAGLFYKTNQCDRKDPLAK